MSIKWLGDGNVTLEKAGSIYRTFAPAATSTDTFSTNVTSVSQGWTQATSGTGGAWSIEGQQGFAGSIGGNLKLAVGKGGTPGTNAAGDLIFENGQTVASASGFTRWQANGSDYITLQQTSTGPTFTTPDGTALTMKASGAGTTLNANTGNLNLFGNNLATLYAAALLIGGSTITYEDVGLHTRLVWNNVAAWVSTFDASVTSVTESWTQTASGPGGTWSITGQQGAFGSIGGTVQITAGKGGNPGTNLAGGVKVDLGKPVAGSSSEFGLYTESNKIGFSKMSSSSLVIGNDGYTSGGLILEAVAGTLNLESIVGDVSIFSGGSIKFNPGSQQYVWLSDSGNFRTDTIAGSALYAHDTVITGITWNQNDLTSTGTGGAFSIVAQNATAVTSTGGKVNLTAGTGTLKGGNLELFAGTTGSSGTGGDVIIGGGTFSLGGEAGNIALHKLTAPSFGNGGRITYISNFHTEPTANPSLGLFVWSRVGQLTTRDQKGSVEEVSARWVNTSNATGTITLVRADGYVWSTASVQTVLQISSVDLPSQSNWVCHAVAEYLISDTTGSQHYAKEYKDITFTKTSGTIAVQTANTIGSFYDGTGAAVNANGCTASVDGSNNLNFTVNSLKGEALSAYVKATLTFFIP